MSDREVVSGRRGREGGVLYLSRVTERRGKRVTVGHCESGTETQKTDVLPLSQYPTVTLFPRLSVGRRIFDVGTETVDTGGR